MSEMNRTNTPPERRRVLKLLGTAGVGGAFGVMGSATAQQHSEDRYYDIEPMSITVHDGTILRGHAYLPQDAERPLAPVLNFSPYWNTSNRGPSNDPSENSFIHEFLQDGFAVVVINIRGTGISDGCLQFGGPLDFADAHDVVEAVAAQVWSNGKVGMWGHSYDAWSQYLAIAGDPPSLEAIAPHSGVIDLWSLLTRTGAPLVGLGPTTRIAWDGLTSIGALPPQPDHVDCPNRTHDWFVNANLAVNADKTPYFAERNYEEQLANSDVPMFVANGLLPFLEGHIMQIEGLYDLRPPQTTRMLLGQWAHAPPPHTENYFDKVRNWFDHYLRGGPRALKPGVVEYQDDTGTWYQTDQWPPEDSHQEIYLSDRSLVSEETAVVSSTQVFQSEDTDPGLSAERCGPRQALYFSSPIQDDVRLAGNFTIETTITSTLSGGNFAAFLFHTPGPGTCPDPYAQRQDSFADDQIGRSHLEFARALADLRHWQTPGHARPFPVAEPTTVSFESHPFATEIRAGNRLVLAIAGGSSELTPNQRKPAITVTTGPSTPGSVELPVVEGSLQFTS